MKNRKILLPALLSIALVFSLILPASIVGASAAVPLPDDRSINHLAIDGSRLASAMALNTPQGKVTPMVAAGGYHTVGLKSDSTVVAVGDNYDGQCDVGGWTDIVQIAAGSYHTVGVKDDGTVVAVGDNEYGQCDVGGWTDIVQIAAGSYHTVGLKDDGTVVAVGSVATWNLVLALPPSQRVLTISSTAGGSVTSPGEGTFIYDEGTVGYLFVNWTGDLNNIADVYAAATNITMDDNYSLTANFVGVTAGNVGIKAGDWIKYEYTISGWPSDQPYAEWMKLEFLSVAGTSATVQVTLHMSDGTEPSETVPVDIAAGGGEAFGFSGFVISTNLTTGDSIYMSGFGDVAIEGETTRTCAGARRTVVYASVSQSIPYQGEVQFTYYWDKLTGVMVEASMTYADITSTDKATETNMWEATVRMPWWPWIIVAVAAVGVVIFFVSRRRVARTKGR